MSPDSRLAVIWGIAVLLAVAAWKCRGNIRSERRLGWKYLVKRLGTVAAGAVLALYSGYVLTTTDFLEQQGFVNYMAIGSNVMYSMNGYLVTTCIDINRYRINKPDDYSVHRVEEILSKRVVEEKQISDETLPHVILILNESFSDLRIWGDLEISRENMSFFYSLKENTVSGYVNASAIGGGTANSEFEVLTGCSMGFLPDSYYVYEERLRRPSRSLVSLFEEYGYTTVSVHPESSVNWNRKMIYKNYGIDTSFWIDDFKGAEIIHSGVSDLETYQKIEEIYEDRKAGEKLFVFGLTMQNHGGYGTGDVEYDVTAINFDSPAMNHFLSLIDISDKAFEKLIAYFEQQDEKVIICMFGDHQPMLRAPEGDLNYYKTPFVIWANYDIPEREGLDISMNYLGPVLLETIGIDGSAFHNYLLELMEEYPIITANGYVDREGEIFRWSGTEEEFPEYRILQYNYLFDTKTVDWGF